MSADVKKCKTCLYRMKLCGNKIGGFYCGYLFYTGHMRGCEAKNCEKHEKYNLKKRRKLVDRLKTRINYNSSERVVKK